MNHYYVWITVMFEHYVNDIVAELVKHGYEVRGLTDENSPTKTYRSCSIIQLSVKGKIKSASLLNDALVEILKTTKTLYYSLIICAPTEGSWITGNIVIPETPPPPSKPIDAIN